MPSALWKSDLYTTPFSYIAADIHEYDISKANISILADAGILDDSQYQYYFDMPKQYREVAIGKLQRRLPGTSEALKEGFSRSRELFFSQNNLQDSDIISIRKDAVYTTRPVQFLQVGPHTAFSLRGNFTSYLRIVKKEFYYFYDIVSRHEHYSIKGFSDESLSLHSEYMLDFILAVLNAAQTNTIQTVLEMIRNFYMRYINRQLPIEYYRRFDSRSMFDIVQMAPYSIFEASFLDESAKSYIDISYNENILRQLEKTFASIYIYQQTK